MFRQPIKQEVKEIAEIMLRDVFKPLTEKEITLEVSDRFKERLVDEGFNPAYGARPLRRAIERLLEDVLGSRCSAIAPLHRNQAQWSCKILPTRLSIKYRTYTADWISTRDRREFPRAEGGDNR